MTWIKIIFALAVLLVVPASWAGNAYKLAKADFEAPYGEEVVRSISVFVVPLSIITVWVDFE